MGLTADFSPETLIVGVLSADPGASKDIVTELESHFGPVDYESPVLDFNYTEYYTPEMGIGLKRWFYSFRELVQPDRLGPIKILTNKIEMKYAPESGNRSINLDPGLLDLNRLILATTKNVGHRIPLTQGIYGEVTLIYMKKDYHALPWTYPDYQSEEYKAILKEIRDNYRQKLKQHK